MFTITVRGLQTSESDVYRRQILTSKVDSHAARVNKLNPNSAKAEFMTLQLKHHLEKHGEFQV